MITKSMGDIVVLYPINTVNSQEGDYMVLYTKSYAPTLAIKRCLMHSILERERSVKI